MKPEHREQLVTLLPLMRKVARRQKTQNSYHRAMHLCDELRDFLDCGPSTRSPEEWIEIAENEFGLGVQPDTTTKEG